MHHHSFRGQLTRRQLLRLAGALGGTSAILSVLAACQPASPAQPAPGATRAAGATTPVPAQQATAAATAAQVVILQGVDANTLDPSFRNSTPEFNINAHLFSMMAARDAKSLQMVPEFLREWKLIDDLTWELKFEPGARFDDGVLPADGCPGAGERPHRGRRSGRWSRASS